MYKYRDISEGKTGDIIECTSDNISGFTKGKLYILNQNIGELGALTDDTGATNGFYTGYQKLLATKPGSEAKVGDTVISLSDVSDMTRMTGSIHKILGKTVTLHAFIEAFTTSIPVVKVK